VGFVGDGGLDSVDVGARGELRVVGGGILDSVEVGCA